MRRIFRDAAERQRLVTEYRLSGLSAPAFAKGAQLSPSTLYAWLAGARSKNGGKRVRMARIVRTQALLPAVQSLADVPPIVLQVGAVRMTVPHGFDRKTLREVLDVLATGRGGAP